MKRLLFVLLSVVALSSSTGCCCLDKLFCCGGCNPCGSMGGCSSCDSCGYGGGSCSSGGCSTCGGGGGGGMYSSGPYTGAANGRAMMAGNPHPAHGHPLAHERRDAGGEYEFAAGPPSGGTTYPYYTNRGPRDFLARNPRDIGP